MSAPAVKPALPASGAQAPKVGSGAPPATANNPPPPVSGGPKVLPTTGSPNRPLAPPNANHATVGPVPLSLVQEHKGGGGLNQQTSPVNRMPEKPVASTVGIKPTSNGVEGSPNRPMTASQPSVEMKKSDEGNVGTAVMNHSADIAATPSQPQPSLHNPLVSGTQLSPAKSQAAPLTSSTTNHSTLVSATSKLETAAAAAAAEVKPPTSLGAAQSAEPPPPPQTQQQAPTPTQQTQQSTTQQQQQAPQLTPQPPQQQQQQAPQQNQQQQVPQQQLQAKSTPTPAPQATPQPVAPVPPQTQPSSTPSQQNPPAAPVQPQTVTPPTQEPPAKPTVQAVESTKTRIEAAPKPEFKVATPPRNSKRKREVKLPAEATSAGSTKTSTSSEQDDRKSKRVRTQTQPYQSPLPELTYIAKLKTLMKSPDDKLIVFYKNEFLAVRNAEGGFYICQAMQNIYKSSPRIRIRWLSQEKKDNKSTDVYIPDFYDATDFDCILTNLELKKLDKNKYQLPDEERERTQSILKRALDVEKGVSEKPPVTEEHPDGLDLSLFRDESQLKKRKSLKRSTPRKKGKENTSGTEDGYEGLTGDESEEEVKKKKPKHSKKVEKSKEKAKTKEKPVEKKAERVSERGRDRSLAAKRRSESTAAAAAAAAATAAAAAKNAAVKQTVAKHVVAKPADKKSKTMVRQTPKKPEPAVETSIPTRSTKTRSAKVTSQPKSSLLTRTKERERRGTTPAKGRKKPGKKA